MKKSQKTKINKALDSQLVLEERAEDARRSLIALHIDDFGATDAEIIDAQHDAVEYLKDPELILREVRRRRKVRELYEDDSERS